MWNLKAEDLVFSEENDVIIPASGETQIDIATASCILKSGVALGGDLNIIKSPIDGIFLAYYLNNSKKKDIAKLAQGISIVHLYSSQLKTLSINLPEKEEQQKISSFLNSIDGYISLLENKKILIERYKQGVMRKIFSQEIRFKQNNGHKFISWEKKFLNDLFSFHRGSSLSKNDIVESGKNKCIHYGELFTSYSERISKIHSLTNANGTLSRFGDILMPSSDVTPLGLATASVILENGVIIGGDINILRPKIKIDSLYVSYFLNFHKKQILKIVSGTTVKHIYNKDLGKLLISIPQIEEQQKISSFLSNIDYRIECHSEELI